MKLIRDVIDIVKQVQDFQSNPDNLSSKLLKPSSARPTIFKNAAGMIAYFPILVSENVNFEQLEKVRIGLEAEYAGYLGLAINAKAALSGEDSTAKDVLGKVHTNELPSKGINVDYTAVRALLDESVKLDSRTLADDMNLNLLEGNKQTNTDEANGVQLNVGGIKYTDGRTINITDSDRKTQAERDAEIARNRAAAGEHTARAAMTAEQARTLKAQGDVTRSTSGRKLDYNSSAGKRMAGSNQTAPTLIDVRVPLANGGAVAATYGVKCQIHTLKENEIKKYTAETIKKKSMAFRLIQWYTGELKMWKDIILNNKDNKKLALSSPWWKFLYNNAKINKFKAFIRNDYMMIPNATLILTEEQVSTINREYGVDVEKNAGVLVNELFLARLIILDQANSTLNIYDERAKSFQRITIDSIYINKDSTKIEDLFKNIR